MPDWFWYIPAPLAITLYVTYYVRHRRRKESRLASEAAAQGWQYRTSDSALGQLYTGKPFSNSGRKARHVISGVHRDRRFVAYEFSFRTSIGYQYANDGLLRNRCRYQVVAAQHGRNDSLDFTVTPADILSKASDAIFKDGRGIGSERFRRRFSLSTRNDDAAQVLTATVSDWLADDPRATENPLKFEKGDAVTWRGGAITVAATIERLDYLNDVLEKMPSSD